MEISFRTIALATTVAAGSMLGGCATTHVGDDWQCPVVRGVPCQDVVDADPAGAGARQREAAAAPGDLRSEACGAGCRPFGWLRRAFAGGETQAGGRIGTAAESAAGPQQGPAVDPQWDDLRTPEVIGRIWIAPYVDAQGVYREGAWVRAVLRPARWKLP